MVIQLNLSTDMPKKHHKKDEDEEIPLQQTQQAVPVKIHKKKTKVKNMPQGVGNAPGNAPWLNYNPQRRNWFQFVCDICQCLSDICTNTCQSLCEINECCKCLSSIDCSGCDCDCLCPGCKNCDCPGQCPDCSNCTCPDCTGCDCPGSCPDCSGCQCPDCNGCDCPGECPDCSGCDCPDCNGCDCTDCC